MRKELETLIEEYPHRNIEDVAKHKSLQLYYRTLNELFERATSVPIDPDFPPEVPFENFVLDYVEASYIGGFIPNDVYIGKVMPIYFPIQHPSHLPFAVSKEMVDSSITYPMSDLTKIFKPLSTLQDFPLENEKCEIRPEEAESRVCVRNMDSISEFIGRVFGSEGSFRIVETKQAETSAASLQEYTVLEEPQEIQGPRKVFCHPKKNAFYCHYSGHTKVLKALLGTQNGDKMETIAVCHDMNIAGQNPNNILQRLLRVKPGTTAPLCHFLPGGHFVWIQSPSSDNYS